MSTFDGTLLSLKDFQTGISAAESLEKGGRDGFVAKYVNEQSELAVGVVEEVKKPSRLGKQKTNFPLRSHVSNLAKFQSRISLKKSQTGAMFKNSRISGIVKIGNHCIEIPKDNPGQEPLEAIASPHFEKKQDQRDNIHPSRDQNQHANIRNLVTSDSAIATNTEAVKESTCFPQQKEQFRYVDPRLPPIRADQTQQQMESRSAQQCNQPEEQDQGNVNN